MPFYSANFEKLQVDISQQKVPTNICSCAKKKQVELNWADRVWNQNSSNDLELQNQRSCLHVLVLCSRFSECNTIQQKKTQKIRLFLLPLQIPPNSIFDLVSFLLMGSNSAITDPADLHPRALRLSKSISSRLRLIHSICTSSRILLLWLFPSFGVSSSVLKVTPSPPSVPSWSAAIRRFQPPTTAPQRR